jgi:hypothetical protein
MADACPVRDGQRDQSQQVLTTYSRSASLLGNARRARSHTDVLVITKN